MSPTLVDEYLFLKSSESHIDSDACSLNLSQCVKKQKKIDIVTIHSGHTYTKVEYIWPAENISQPYNTEAFNITQLQWRQFWGGGARAPHHFFYQKVIGQFKTTENATLWLRF